MKLKTLKQKHAKLAKLIEKDQYDKAFALSQELLEVLPGNARLLVVWAQLAMLQENSSLEEVERALQLAIELDDGPMAAVEYGYFLKNVQDNEKSAKKWFETAKTTTDNLLVAYMSSLAQMEK